MSKSSLCHRIELHDSVHRLNEDGCFEAIQLLSNILGNGTLNDFLISIITTKHCLVQSNSQLQDFNTKLNQLSLNSEYIQQSRSCKSNKNTAERSKNEEEQESFPLLRLPVDLVTKTSLYLNEADIFKFEQCCRLFYTMINNTSYLKQSNNFKTFIIDNARSRQLTKPEYSFFKYSKAKALRFDNSANRHLDPSFYNNSHAIEQLFHNMNNQWDKIAQIRKKNGLFDNLFCSIKSLSFSKVGMGLLGKMPLKLLFGMYSQLQTMKFIQWSSCCSNYNGINQYQLSLKKFEENYNNLQNDLVNKRETTRKLKIVEHEDLDGFKSIGRLRCVSKEHLSLTCMVIDLEDILNIRVLTCKDNVQFRRNTGNSDSNPARATVKGRYNIETLRLLRFTRRSCLDILNDTNVIQSLNLDQSCKNMLVQLDLSSGNSSNMQNVIKSILEKDVYCSLENVNVVLKLRHCHLDWIFSLLQQNVQMLKHQFKQFNIGMNVCSFGVLPDVYQIIEWNSNIDEKFLDAIQVRMNKSNEDNYKDKYYSLLNKWS